MSLAPQLVLLFTLFYIVYNKQPKFPKLPIYCISTIFGMATFNPSLFMFYIFNEYK